MENKEKKTVKKLSMKGIKNFFKGFSPLKKLKKAATNLKEFIGRVLDGIGMMFNKAIDALRPKLGTFLSSIVVYGSYGVVTAFCPIIEFAIVTLFVSHLALTLVGC